MGNIKYRVVDLENFRMLKFDIADSSNLLFTAHNSNNYKINQFIGAKDQYGKEICFW